MRIPEALFPAINLIVRGLLCSPLHPFMSKSLMLIRFRGHRTNRLYTTPVRYLRDHDTIRCFTSKDTRWWRNIGEETQVVLRIEGKERSCVARAIVDAPDEIRPHLLKMLELFPADAPYHNLTLDAAGKPNPDALDVALQSTVMIVASPAKQAA